MTTQIIWFVFGFVMCFVLMGMIAVGMNGGSGNEG